MSSSSFKDDAGNSEVQKIIIEFRGNSQEKAELMKRVSDGKTC
jgi:hypothetical protein